jgi:hypothetical protein
MAEVIDKLPDDLQDKLAFAIRAGDLAGLPESRVHCGAYMACAEILLDRAERISVAAQYADRMAWRQQEERQADQYRQLAFSLQHKAKEHD